MAYQGHYAIFLFFRLSLPCFCWLILSLCLGACSYKYSTETVSYSTDDRAASHWLYNVIPRHRCQVYWYDFGHWSTWAFFGNDDDGIFGEAPTAQYYPQQKPSLAKAIRWWCRNPLHNFCFYIIGTAYQGNSEITLLKMTPCCFEALTYRPEGQTDFASNHTSFYVGLHGWKPFISLRIAYFQRYQSDFYLGWRHRGNFGIKCLPFKRRKERT